MLEDNSSATSSDKTTVYDLAARAQVDSTGSMGLADTIGSSSVDLDSERFPRRVTIHVKEWASIPEMLTYLRTR